MLTFSKTRITNHTIDDKLTVREGWVYRLFDKEQMIGSYLFDKRLSRFYLNDQVFSVDKKKNIVNLNNESKIGKFTFPNWTFFDNHKYKLTLNDQEYRFKKTQPDVRASVFKKDTWGHFKFLLTNDHTDIVYKFKIDIPTIALGNPYLEKPYNGIIEGNFENHLLTIAGFKVIEQALDDETIS
jgi:hypothetical protein